ncbi:unnamed protein product [Echinostoma caproni]|uniref:Nup54 domain-containing protein n=1 Tax=Echinostoma caproni TaxID=27848 RepID=A0A183AZH1_9TREM|nr:unnamed protein product [Echinostoma caproni]
MQPVPSNDVPLPKSLQIAAAQFSAALQAEAESGRAAWRDLFEMMQKGPQKSEPRGVDVTESKLLDTELFLRALSEVLRELKSSSADRKEEISNSATYAERLRKALRVCAAGDWLPVLAGHLDPESARMLGRLKQKARLAESGLFDLDNQLESLSVEVKRQLASSIRSPRRSGIDPKMATTTPTPTSKLISVMDTTTRLLQTERGRVNYLMEGFRRLQLLNDTPMKDMSQSIDSSCSVRRAHRSRVKGTVTAAGDQAISPALHSVIQRDRALYRLFAKHKLPTVHAQFVCPLIADETETDIAAVTDNKDLEPTNSLAGSAGVTEIVKNNPQQQQLEKLIGLSSHEPKTVTAPTTTSTATIGAVNSSVTATTSGPIPAFSFSTAAATSAGKLFGQTGPSLPPPAGSLLSGTSTNLKTSLVFGTVKPVDSESRSVVDPAFSIAVSSPPTLPLFGTASKTQSASPTSTGSTSSTGGLFQSDTLTVNSPAPSTLTTTAATITTVPSVFGLFGTHTSSPATATPIFGSSVAATAANASTNTTTSTSSVSLFGAPSKYYSVF